MKLMNMMARYYSVAAAHIYYIGFIVDGELYMFVIHGEIPAFLLRLTYTSKDRSDLVKIQVKATDAKARYIHDKRVVHLGPATLLDYNDGYNKGQHFERYIVEHFAHQTWEPNNTPWFESGDVIIDGEHVQCKFHDATVISEKTLENQGL